MTGAVWARSTNKPTTTVQRNPVACVKFLHALFCLDSAEDLTKGGPCVW